VQSTAVTVQRETKHQEKKERTEMSSV